MGEFDWDKVAAKSAVTANPAAGADPVGFTVPAGKRYLLLSMFHSLQRDGNPANVYESALITDGTGTTSMGAISGAMTSPNPYNITFAPGVRDVSTTNFFLPLPEGLELQPGSVVSFTITSKQVGDDWSATRYVFKEAPA